MGVRSAVLARDWRERAVSPADAAAAIRAGDQVFVSSACATPTRMLHALEDASSGLPGVRLLHSITRARPDEPRRPVLDHRVWYVSRDLIGLVASRRVQYAPVTLNEIPQLLQDGRLRIQVAIVAVSEPNAAGFCSLGVSADLGRAMIAAAPLVIGEIIPGMPWTRGDTLVPFESFDLVVEGEAEPLEYRPQEEMGPAADQIARYVARIVPDGATLQLGLGTIPGQVLRHLHTRRHLGVHSEVIYDTVADLVDAGVITGRHKAMSRGRIVTSLAMGTRRLYDAIDNNRAYTFRPIEQVADPRIIRAQNRMVSITQADLIDLTGQVCAESRDGAMLGGVGVSPVFHYAAARSNGGRAIVCLPSRDSAGRSSIRATLGPTEPVTIPRYETHWVVTEFGAAYVFGATRRQRAVALLELAHPDDRDELLAEAKRMHLLPEDQRMRSRRDYPVEESRELTLTDGTTLRVRPTTTADAGLLQELFYALNPEDVRTRFFRHLSSLTKEAAEHLTSVSYDQEMAFAVVTGDEEQERIVGNSAYFVDPQTRLADVGYMIDPEWQGRGIGGALHAHTIDYARRHGVRGFTADVLEENLPMLRVFEHGPGRLRQRTYGGVTELVLLFDPPEGGDDPVGPPNAAGSA
jgi:acyl-CoA hydrolase/GNAT superfamily N-acetyltransferase